MQSKSSSQVVTYLTNHKWMFDQSKDIFFSAFRGQWTQVNWSRHRSTIILLVHLFVKVPQPGDNEMTFSVFELCCHLLLPV